MNPKQPSHAGRPVTIDLPPREDLLMEVLAARVRCGESCWTFDPAHRPTLRALELKGLLHFDPDPGLTGLRTFLTDAGREAYLLDGFTEPVEHLRDALDETHARLEAANEARRSFMTKTNRLEQENTRLRRQPPDRRRPPRRGQHVRSPGLPSVGP